MLISTITALACVAPLAFTPDASTGRYRGVGAVVLFGLMIFAADLIHLLARAAACGAEWAKLRNSEIPKFRNSEKAKRRKGEKAKSAQRQFSARPVGASESRSIANVAFSPYQSPPTPFWSVGANLSFVVTP